MGSTEEELRSATIGPLKPLNGTITISEYDPAWPSMFEQQARRIGSALGARALQVEHAGSTSVPGLAAKPIIDIYLVVANSADEPSYVRDLEAAGYVLRIREPDWNEHRMFKGVSPDVNLHCFSDGCPEIQKVL